MLSKCHIDNWIGEDLNHQALASIHRTGCYVWGSWWNHTYQEIDETLSLLPRQLTALCLRVFMFHFEPIQPIGLQALRLLALTVVDMTVGIPHVFRKHNVLSS